LLTECNPYDGKESFSPLLSESSHSTKMAKSIAVKSVLSSDNVDANRQAVDVDNHHSIGSSIGTDTASNMNKKNACREVVELTNDKHINSIVINRQAVDVDSHHSIGSSIGTDTACKMNRKSACREVVELTIDKHTNSIVINRQAVDVDSHHSIGSSIGKDTGSNMNKKNASLEVMELTNGKHTNSIVINKCHVVEASTNHGSSRADGGENAPRQILEMPRRADAGERRREKLQCTVCGKWFARYYLKTHMGLHSGKKPYSCSFCDMKFRLNETLKWHELGHKGELPQCDLCGGRFVSLNKHMINVHSGANYKYACSVCKKGFRMQAKLKTHMLTHSEERPYTCQDCGGCYRGLHDLKRHMKKHLAIHTREKSHACVVCGKKFSQSAHVNIHMRTHTGEKPYRCETCSKTFRALAQLCTHQRTHTQEKPYICTTCGKGFGQSAALRRHELIHSGVQPYECSECGMRFNQSNSMQRHMLTHTGEKPYSCTDCGHRFTQSGGLASHRRRHCSAKNTQT